MCKITVVSESLKILDSLEAKPHQSLYQLLANRGWLDAPCGGGGTCGKCKIKILNPLSLADLPSNLPDGCDDFLSPQELAEGWRLACQLQPQRDLQILVPAAFGVSPIVAQGFLQKFVLQPVICKKYEAAKNQTLVYAQGSLITTEAGDTSQANYGVAVDIGTTTVVAGLVDLNTGKELLSLSCLNSQKSFGQDVISRITYAKANGGLQTLQRAIAKDLQSLFKALLAEQQIDFQHIYAVAVAANPTMVHLLAGIDPKSLGEAPYGTAFQGALLLDGVEDLALPVNQACQVYCLPHISAFVGGDIVAGVLACGLNQAASTTLFLDLGTNGELILANQGRLLACACAAGPALEGMNLSCGMRAAAGAIENLEISQNPNYEAAQNGSGKFSLCYETIGGGRAIGLCGSGILAAITQLLKVGAILPSGSLAEPADFPDLIEKVSGKKRVIIQQELGIYLTQRDIRQVQLAKGAILAGIQSLLQAVGLVAADVDVVLVAGQFGANLNPQALTGAGLLPKSLAKRIKYVGNTAKAGAYLALVSQASRAEGVQLATEINYIELSNQGTYDELFVSCLNFKGE